MKCIFSFLFLFIMLEYSLTAQTTIQPDGGGYADMYQNMRDEMSIKQRNNIIKMLKSNEAALRKKGLLSKVNQNQIMAFQWLPTILDIKIAISIGLRSLNKL